MASFLCRICENRHIKAKGNATALGMINVHSSRGNLFSFHFTKGLCYEIEDIICIDYFHKTFLL